MEIKNRIVNYWDKRSSDFAHLRYEELSSYMADLFYGLKKFKNIYQRKLAKSSM